MRKHANLEKGGTSNFAQGVYREEDGKERVESSSETEFSLDVVDLVDSDVEDDSVDDLYGFKVF